MVYKVKDMLQKLSTNELEEVKWFLNTLIIERPKINRVVEAIGSQERVIKLQLKAFQRIPSEIIVEYMTEEERNEYEVLIG